MPDRSIPIGISSTPIAAMRAAAAGSDGAIATGLYPASASARINPPRKLAIFQALLAARTTARRAEPTSATEQLEARDSDVERIPIFVDHSIGAAHFAVGRVQRAAGDIVEAGARSD